jgi:membrane protease YdiL (CAAX protease family)
VIRDLAAASAAVAGYNALLHRVVPPRLRMPANLGAATVAVVLVHCDGATWEELGLAPRHTARSARAGALVAAPIVATTAALALLPPSRRHFHDTRVATAPNPAFEIALRIPVGTALCEELLFRSALLAYLDRHTNRIAATITSSLLFGLWHVLPARESRVDAGSTVWATTVAGIVFVGIRRRTRSVAAPTVVHAALNASAFVAARLATRCTRQ